MVDLLQEVRKKIPIEGYLLHDKNDESSLLTLYIRFATLKFHHLPARERHRNFVFNDNGRSACVLSMRFPERSSSCSAVSVSMPSTCLMRLCARLRDRRLMRSLSPPVLLMELWLRSV